MRLSIVTINFNNVEGLQKTLASVASQTYRDIEHIIIDGGSTDGSVDVIREYEQQLHITHSTIHLLWASERDHGIYDGMNKGVKKATGDYVWILNSGDCAASSDTVEFMMGIIAETNIDILLGNKIHVYPNDKKAYDPLSVKRISDLKPRPIEVSMLTFYSGTIPQDAAFVRRYLFEKYGYFDDKLKICADWKLYLNMIALDGVQPWHVNVDVVLFDMTGISNANTDLLKAEKRAYLQELLPASVLKDYEAYAFPIHQYQRLKKYHLWGLVYFIERVLFKFEKWGVLR